MSAPDEERTENKNTIDDTKVVEKLSDLSGSDTDSSAPYQMEEIYSTRDKQIKYKKLEPLEAEKAAKRKAEAKQELMEGKIELSPKDDYKTPDIALEAELSPDTVVADDIIEDVRELKNLRGIYVRDIDDIDISLDPEESVRKYEKKAGDTERYDRRRSSSKTEQTASSYQSGGTIVSKIPVYIHETETDIIPIKAGKFTEVVESEYDEYLQSADPMISKNYHMSGRDSRPRQSLLFTLSQMAAKRKEEHDKKEAQTKAQLKQENYDEEVPQPPKKKSRVAKFFRVMFRLIGQSFISTEEEEFPTEYESGEDLKYIRSKIDESAKKLWINLLLLSIVGALLLAAAVIERIQLKNVFSFIPGGPLIYCIVDLVALLVAGVFGRNIIISGLKPLSRFKGNCDTLAALSYLSCVIQNIVAVFMPLSFAGGECHLYGFIPVFAMILNTVGRLLMTLRVKSNYEFISSQTPAYAAKIYNDEEIARRMVSGTTSSKGVVAYQHVTKFLSDFLKISYAPDPGEEIAGRVTPVTVVCALFVAIAYAFVFKNAAGVISALSVMLCIGIPFSSLLAGNLPLFIFSKSMLKSGAMVAGYPSVRQFCDTGAIMVKAKDLFPNGSVRLAELKAAQRFRVEEGLLAAAMVMKEAQSPLYEAFAQVVDEKARRLPTVESVLYEDKSGLVGWVDGERILIGNTALMNRYHITVPDEIMKLRENNKEVTFIAQSGQLLAAASVSYLPAQHIEKQLRSAEKNGISIIVATTDANITAELIADRFGLFFRSVKILPTGYASVVDEVTSKTEETSRAYLATRGKFTSLCRAVAGCVGIRSNITLGIVIGLFGLALGVLLCATMALYATTARLSITELLIYILFWLAATIVGELVRRP